MMFDLIPKLKMQAVGGLLGIGGGASGSGFAAPAAASITNPVNATQLSNAYTGAQGALGGQSSLLTALQGQGGLGNQNQVYGQLQGVVNGRGPNPAQAMLNQSTGQNVANQAALMAGQRGASANTGLIARQAAQQGAGIQQNAVGQGATLQAQQSLNALGQAGGLANTQAANQIGQTNANTQNQIAEQQALLNAQQGFNTAQVGSQGSVNAGNVNLANTTMGGQQSGIGGLFNAIGGASNMFGGSAGGGGGSAALDGSSTLSDGSSTGSMLTGSSGGYAEGGAVKKYAEGGAAFTNTPQSEFGQFLQQQNQPQQTQAPSNPIPSDKDLGYNDVKPKSGSGLPTPSLGALESAGNWVGNGLSDSGSWIKDAFTNIGEGFGNGVSGFTAGLGTMGAGTGTIVAGGAGDAGAAEVGAGAGEAVAGGATAGAAAAANGGDVKALVSPGEIYLSPQAVQMVRNGADPMHVGERIPGKPKVGGAKNSYSNDTVPKTLQTGGIVVPRSKTQTKSPDKDSRQFVNTVLAKRKVRK